MLALSADICKKAAVIFAPLTRQETQRQIQRILGLKTTSLAETGDAWFNSARMDLPKAFRFEDQMQ